MVQKRHEEGNNGEYVYNSWEVWKDLRITKSSGIENGSYRNILDIKGI